MDCEKIYNENDVNREGGLKGHSRGEKPNPFKNREKGRRKNIKNPQMTKLTVKVEEEEEMTAQYIH